MAETSGVFGSNRPFVKIFNRAICKTIFSPKLCVMLEILSSEYQ
jgi:hypothetical protein